MRDFTDRPTRKNDFRFNLQAAQHYLDKNVFFYSSDV